jgi:VWFA-related protein
MNKNILFVFLIFFLFFLFSLGNLKTEPLQNKQEQRPLRHEVSVTLKLIQVYVTDKQGNPVMDLGKSDFALFDNDKSQQTTEFEKHVIPSSPEKIEPPSVSETMNRKFILFFDFAFNNLDGINMAKKTALHFIDTQLVPTDEVGVISYSTTKGLFLYEYLTTDHAKIREVINQIGFKETLGRAGQFLEDIGGMQYVSGKASLVKAAQERWKTIVSDEKYRFEIHQFSSALKEFAKALRYIPGYKHIIFFSLGIPNYLMYQIGPQIAPQQGTMNINATSGLNTRIRCETMLSELAASNSPVLAVNVNILLNAAFSDAFLREMAKLTGGRYFGETNDYKKIAQDIQNLTSSYYVLGYKIDEKWDGRYHRINVTVKRPECDVYYQKGYFNPKPFAKYSDLEKKLHLIDLALAERPYFENPIHFPLRALASPMKQRSNLALIAEIPVEKIQDVSKEKIEIFDLVFDEKQNIVSQQRTEMEPSSLSQDKIYFYSISYLPPGSYDCRVVMRNLETGRGAVASSSIVIPKRFEEGLRLYSPLVLIPGKKGTYLNGSATEKGQEKPYALPDFYPFNPDQYTPLVNELSQDTNRLLVLLPSSIIRFEKSNMNLSAHLVNLSSGERRILPLTILGQQQEEAAITYALEVQTDNLPPGKYSLYLFAEDSESHHPFTYVTCPLAVR